MPMPAPFRAARRVQALGLVFLSSLAMACGEIEIPLNLAVDPAQSTIEIQQPLSTVETFLTGGVETRAIVDLDLLKLLSPHGIVATIAVDDLLIAGDSILIAGLLPTGTICVTPAADPPGSGLALLQPIRSQAVIQMDLFTQIQITEPAVADLLGPPLPFDASIDATVPLTLSDLFGLFLGGGGGLVLSQTIETTLPADLPLVGGSPVIANVTLASVEEIPADPLLLDCVGL